MFEGEPVEIPINGVLDLHTFAPHDIKAAVEAYIEEAQIRGLTGLRIIHGKGIGVQRQIVRELLTSNPGVARFSDAPAEAGGWGATLVTLRSSERKGNGEHQ
jgi:DNA-nicking Smr family endonuclease